MTKEKIIKFLTEEVGITGGDWTYNGLAGIMPEKSTYRRIALVGGHPDITEENNVEANGRLLAASFNSLVALIEDLWFTEEHMDYSPYEISREWLKERRNIIESATGMSWDKVREGVEEC